MYAKSTLPYEAYLLLCVCLCYGTNELQTRDRDEIRGTGNATVEEWKSPIRTEKKCWYVTYVGTIILIYRK